MGGLLKKSYKIFVTFQMPSIIVDFIVYKIKDLIREFRES